MPDRTLLVADDDPGLRESLERTLTREGYRVLLASDGRAALERLQDGAIDLIVTDLKMPGLTGLELLRAAKAIAPDVDVILLTARSEEHTSELQSLAYLVCRLLLEKKKKHQATTYHTNHLENKIDSRFS